MAERITRPLVLGSVNDLRGSHPLVDVGRLPRTADSTYSPDAPLLWIEGREMLTGTPRWVPYEMVHTAYTVPRPTGTGCFIATSNGLASGNHRLEAVSHAICETVERDAATLHSVRTLRDAASRRLDLTTVDDPGCLEALDRLDRAAMSVAVWDITSDVGIPAFTCLIAERRQSPAVSAYDAEGMGCHPDRNVALLRALTEAAQSRLGHISGARDDPSGWEHAYGTGEHAYGTGEEAPPGPAADLDGEAARDFTAVPAFDGDSFDADVAWELAAVRSAGISEVVLVDLTHEDFGIPVVRVIVPGLEGPVTTVPECRLGQRATELIGG
jgi:thiazole/oxazole-forming peptide maturase SagD family component